MKELLHREYRNKKALHTYLDFFGEDKKRFPWIWIVYIIKAAPVYVLPILTAETINLITQPHTAAEFNSKLTMLMTVGFIVIAQNIPTHMYYVHLMSVPCRRVEKNLRLALCTRLQHLSIPYHTTIKVGSLQNKVTRDVENIEMMSRMLLDTFPMFACSLLVAITMTMIKAPIFLIFYAAAVPIAVILYVLLRDRMKESNREFRKSVEEMSGRVTEMIRLIPITRAHNVEDAEINNVSNKLEHIRKSGLYVDYINSIFGSLNWVVLMLFNLGTLGMIAYLYNIKFLDIGIGDIGLLTGYFASLTGTVLGIMNCLPAITKGLESVKSIGEVLECPDLELNAGKPAVDKVKGDFKFQNVSFRYPSSDSHAVKDINLHVKAGETLALVGFSGAGKSTLAHLVIGFVRPTEGKILLDDNDMNELDLRTYRKNISVVTQETLLFDGSIRDNICYGVNPTAKEVEDAIANANLSEFIDTLPDGIHTQVRENGARLSGGQRQRIAIARALLRNPSVLILDEATSALDVESESQIKEALDRLIKGRTTFIVAHRLSTIRHADRIVVMQEGQIVEIGTHDELLAKNGVYTQMHQKFNSAH